MDRAQQLLQELQGKMVFYEATLKKGCGAERVSFTRGARGEFFVTVFWKEGGEEKSLRRHMSRDYVFGESAKGPPERVERRGCVLLFVREIMRDVLQDRGVL